jgi:hypothetical protein
VLAIVLALVGALVVEILVLRREENGACRLASLVERFGAGSVRTLRQHAIDEAHHRLHWV